MKHFTFSKEEIKIIKSLKEEKIKRVWYSYAELIFDCWNRYYKLFCDYDKADTQNEYDEAIFTEISVYNKSYKKKESDILLFKDIDIQKLYIARTFLFFSNPIKYSKFKRYFLIFKSFILRYIFLDKNPIHTVLCSKNITWEFWEFTCNPDLQETKNIKLAYSNIVDKGLLIKTWDKYLKAYLNNNFFGFNCYDIEHFLNKNQIEKDKEYYKFIEI